MSVVCVFVKSIKPQNVITVLFLDTLQVNIPLPMYNNLPISISLVARHGADVFLLHLVESFYDSIKEEEAAWPRA